MDLPMQSVSLATQNAEPVLESQRGASQGMLLGDGKQDTITLHAQLAAYGDAWN